MVLQYLGFGTGRTMAILTVEGLEFTTAEVTEIVCGRSMVLINIYGTICSWEWSLIPVDFERRRKLKGQYRHKQANRQVEARVKDFSSKSPRSARRQKSRRCR